METWNAIASRRNVREFAGRPVSAGDLNRILEAARRSPSSQNWQPWDFILITDRAQLQQLSAVAPGAGHLAGAAAAIALIAPLEDSRLRRAQYDLGQATMSIMLAAADLGIGTCHSGVSDQDLARQQLGFPQDKTCSFLISLGYPAGRQLAPSAYPAAAHSMRSCTAAAGNDRPELAPARSWLSSHPGPVMIAWWTVAHIRAQSTARS